MQICGKVKEWLHSIGIMDQTAVVQDADEPEDGALPLHHEDIVKNRLVYLSIYSSYTLLRIVL